MDIIIIEVKEKKNCRRIIEPRATIQRRSSQSVNQEYKNNIFLWYQNGKSERFKVWKE